MRTPAGSILAAASTLLLSAGLQGQVSLEVGQPFPQLILPSLEDGRPLSLASFRGQKLILQVWASW